MQIHHYVSAQLAKHKPHIDADISGMQGYRQVARSQKTLPRYVDVTFIIQVLLQKYSSAVKPSLIPSQLQQLRTRSTAHSTSPYKLVR